MELILSVILCIVIYAIVKAPSHNAHNRTCPPGKRADWQKMSLDRINGMSQRDIDIKFCNGGYDIPDDICKK